VETGLQLADPSCEERTGPRCMLPEEDRGTAAGQQQGKRKAKARAGYWGRTLCRMRSDGGRIRGRTLVQMSRHAHRLRMLLSHMACWPTSRSGLTPAADRSSSSEATSHVTSLTRRCMQAREALECLRAVRSLSAGTRLAGNVLTAAVFAPDKSSKRRSHRRRFGRSCQLAGEAASSCAFHDGACA